MQFDTQTAFRCIWSLARNNGNHALLDDLCDEEDNLLGYVRKAISKANLNDRTAKDYHKVWQAINRVITKIRTHKDFKDEEVADYLASHLVIGTTAIGTNN
jgi:hypothetical protein